ncbi:MAG: hypothetical protein ACOY31_09780 [Bacillota bacterium]
MNRELKPQPNFYQFKEFVREAVKEKTGLDDIDDRQRWLEIGDEEKRQEILYSLKAFLEGEYGVEMPLPDNAENADIYFESMCIQLHHTYSNVYLMERINRKVMRNRYRN